MVQKNCIKFDSIIILGATATGKTGLSIELAKKLNTEVVNADSMYIYKDLNIGTAKPTFDEIGDIPHHLISIVDADNSFNVSEYRERAQTVINDMKERELLPIIVGGTGFYIDSLIKDYSYGGAEKDDTIRNQLESELEKYGKEYIYNKLKELDYESYSKLHINDTKRVIRALEIVLTTGTKKSEIINAEKRILNNPLIIGLNMPREDLYNKINKRVDLMINDGLIEEVEGLKNRGLNPDEHQSMKGIGYKEIFEYLEGKSTLEEAIEKIKQHTRNYAKRQITWFKRNENIIWFEISKDNNIVNKIMNLLNGGVDENITNLQ